MSPKKTLLNEGGKDSLGNAVLKRFLQSDLREITFSEDFNSHNTSRMEVDAMAA